MAETEKKVAATEAATVKKTAAKKPAAKKPAAKKTAKKAVPATVTVKLVKGMSGRTDKQIATAHSLGLKKIGDVTVQPDNAQTQGKIAKISHMVAVTKA